MSHRIRAALVDDNPAPFGGEGSDVQVDETFIFTDKDAPPVKGKRGTTYPAKMNVLSLIDRASGGARSFVVDSLKAKDIASFLSENNAKDTRLVTDEAKRYVGHGKMFADHVSVNHSEEEYVNRADPTITTNHVEGYFSVFKGAWRAFTSTAKGTTCTVTSPSSTSVIRTECGSAWAMWSVRIAR